MYFFDLVFVVSNGKQDDKSMIAFAAVSISPTVLAFLRERADRSD